MIPQTYETGDFALSTDVGPQLVFALPDVGKQTNLTLPPALESLGSGPICIKNIGEGDATVLAEKSDTIDLGTKVNLPPQATTTLTPLPDGKGWAIIGGAGLP